MMMFVRSLMYLTNMLWLWQRNGLLVLVISSIIPCCQAFVCSSSAKKKLVIREVDTSTSKSLRTLNNGLFGRDDNDEDLSGTRVLEIPVQSLKQGGLRFTLGLTLIGLQDKGMWKATQTSDNKLDVYFQDNSAMFQVVLEHNLIRVDRYGQPSLVYVLQESLVLHKMLDELNTLCIEGDIEPENRLLQLEDPGAIEKARDTLPARKA